MAEKLQAEYDLAMKAIKDEVERTGP